MRSARHVPPDRWRAERVAKVNDGFDFLVERPNGATGDELAEHLEITKSTAQRVVHDLRLVLGGSDTITVVTEASVAPNEPHIYRLVGNYEEARGWMAGRIADMEIRLETVEFSARAVARGADGRTVEGKKADKIQRTLKYLREELGAMGE